MVWAQRGPAMSPSLRWLQRSSMRSATHCRNSAYATSTYPPRPRKSGEQCEVIDMSAFEYALPNSVEEAVAILSSRSEARPVAGGQSMLVPRNRDRLKGSVLVDLRRLAPLNGISRQDGGVRIGAMASIAAVASNDLVGNEFPAFAEA